MITKQTKLDRMEILSTGVIQIRLAKQIVEDGVVISQSWHRTVIPPGVDPNQQMNVVNQHLVQMGLPHLQDECMSTICDVCEIIHKPEVVKRFKDKRDDRLSYDDK